MEELTALIKTSATKTTTSIANSTVPSTVEFIKEAEVTFLTHKCRSAIYLEEKAGTFPRAVRIGKRGKAYVKSEIIQWMEARMAERNTHIAGAK